MRHIWYFQQGNGQSGPAIDREDGLIANHMGTDEIARGIGVTSLGYLSTEHVKLLTGTDTGFCTACFGGGYPTEVPSNTSKSSFEGKIKEK